MTRVPPGLTGAARPEPVEAASSVWVIAADVPLDVYGPPHLESRLRDLQWVAEAAVAHEAVVEHFARMRNAAVVPMQLFTMFSSLDKALADVRARRATLHRTLRHVAGCEEWGVRVTRVRTDASERSGSASSPDRASMTGGTAFLLARREARNAARAARLESIDAADEAFRRLQRLARDARRRDREPEPGSNPPLLEAAFLVTAASRTRFKAEARRQAVTCADAGAEMTLTGPWPAYNFVDEHRGRS